MTTSSVLFLVLIGFSMIISSCTTSDKNKTQYLDEALPGADSPAEVGERKHTPAEEKSTSSAAELISGVVVIGVGVTIAIIAAVVALNRYASAAGDRHEAGVGSEFDDVNQNYDATRRRCTSVDLDVVTIMSDPYNLTGVGMRWPPANCAAEVSRPRRADAVPSYQEAVAAEVTI